VSLTQAGIEEGLRGLGLGTGDVVEVHSSLSSFGWVEGGARAVIAALMNVVGSGGAIAMSAYLVSRAQPLSEEEVARGLQWKVRILPTGSRERTGMGVIADTFRDRPDVVLGGGTHPVGAWGRDAERHSQGYHQLLADDGWALLLGVDIFRCSSLHQAERLPLPEEIASIFRVPESVGQDYPPDRWVVGYGSTPKLPWQSVWDEALRRALVRTGRIGKAECKLFRARALVSVYEELQRGDIFALYGVTRQPLP
jgi:aminoglycoside N3'-acetyltransferase